MIRFGRLAWVAVGLSALLGCAQPAPPVADTAADEAAIRAVNPAWFAAHKAGDADALAALYAEDAVLSAPGAAAVRGRTAIRESFVKEAAAMAAAGLTLVQGPAAEFGVSGDLGWEWNTFTVTNASGATVDTGKYVTVYARKGGRWLIVRDIWNSDLPSAVVAPAASAAAAEEAPAAPPPGK